MEITGTIQKDATVKQLTTDRQVVEFTIRVRRLFPAKGDKSKNSTFIDCGFFRTSKIAASLRHGTPVTLRGDIEPSAWTDNQGTLRAGINMRVDTIEFIGGDRPKAAPVPAEAPVAFEPADDLPF